MRAPVSVIIPTLNARDALPGCLSALFEGVRSGVIRELILVDGGSRDGTIALGQEAGAQVIRAAPSRGGQLRAGADAARGDWLLFLHADTCLGEGWSEVVLAHLEAETRAGYFRLRFDDGGLAARIVAGWANLRARLFGLPYGDQGLLVSRALYEARGGYGDMPLMEDVALARALRGAVGPLDAVAVTSAEKYRRQGWVRRGGRNLWTLTRYLMGVSPERLARAYRR